MLVFIAAAALMQGSLYSKVILHPTGSNGYEEFVKAADLVYVDDYGAFKNWLDEERSPSRSATLIRPPGVEANDCDLVVRRKFIDRFQGCLPLIQRGNQMAAFDPRDKINAETTFPELAEFRRIAYVECCASHVAFADGQSYAGVMRFEDGMTFGNKINGQVLIDRLVGIAVGSIMLNELDDHWPQLSLADAEELESYFKKLLAAPSPMSDMLRREVKSIEDGLNEFFADKSTLQSVVGDDKKLKSAIAAMGPAEIAQLESDADREIESQYASAVAKLDASEPEQLDLKEMIRSEQMDDSRLPLAQRLAHAMVPTFSQLIVAEARNRTRLRLAYLTAKAVAFRWLNGRLPDRIEDFADKIERVDPTSGRLFKYVRTDRWFTLTRVGNDVLGAVPIVRVGVPADDLLPSRPL